MLLLALLAAQVLTRPPALQVEVPAEYPPSALAAGLEATVLLELELDSAGHVVDAHVLETAGAEFDAAALTAARAFVFEPAEVDGVPAAVRLQYRTHFTLAPPPRPAPSVAGRLRDRWHKRPIVAATVRAQHSAGTRTTSTSTAGTFVIDGLLPGPLLLSLEATGYPVTTSSVVLVEGERTQLEWLLEPIPTAVDDEEVVRAPRPTRTLAQVVVRTDEAQRVPGTQGDTVKVVQLLPGVARPALGSGALSVWGAAPAETRVFLDRVELPALYHTGGVRSLVPAELVERVALTPAGQGVAFGRGVGGVVEVDTTRLPDEPVRAALALDPLDVSGWIRAPLSPSLRVAVSARQSLLDTLAPAVADEAALGLFPLPSYRDLALLGELTLGPGEVLSLLALGSLDGMVRTRVADDPARSEREQTDQDVALLRLSWLEDTDQTRSQVTPSVVWSRRARGLGVGAVSASEDVRELRVGLLAEHRRRLSPAITLVGGLDAALARASVERRGSLTIPAREGDPVVFGRTPSDTVADDAWTTTTVDLAPYLSAELTWGPLSLTPALRLDLYGLGVSRLTPRLALTPAIGGARLEPRLAPRLSATWSVWPERLRLRAAAGLYSQPPEAEARSAVFGNPTLGVSDGAHLTAAIAASPLADLELELAGFLRSAHGLAARSTAPTPRLAEALTDEGEGRAKGLQLAARRAAPRDGDGLFGWLSYTWLRSERRADASAAWRRADFDRSHALSAVVAYAWGPWVASARLAWGSGTPYTPVIGQTYDARRDTYVPRLGAPGSATLPSYTQLDLRAERNFTWDPVCLTVSLELQNVTNSGSIEAPVYSEDYRLSAALTGLPFLALLGAKVEL